MVEYYNILDKIIREELDKGQTIAIYPLGKAGLEAKHILNNRYGRKGILVDNKMAFYNSEVIDINEFCIQDRSDITIILCAADCNLNNDLTTEIKHMGIKARIRNLLERKIRYFEKIKNLCKVAKAEGYHLTRVGESGDGAYIMLDDFEVCDTAYSFGIGGNISWDEWMAGQGLDVHCYDHTIERLPKSNNKLKFHKAGISGMDRIHKNLFSMETLLRGNSHMDKKGIILKMDVEGAEWDFINSASSDVLRQFSQITLELHGLADEANEGKIIPALEKMNMTHQAVWVHGNNSGGEQRAGDVVIPRLLEITYADRARYTFGPVEYNCPLDIDEPNIAGFPDIELRNWGM